MSATTQTVPRHGQLGPTACLLVEKLKDGKPGESLTAEQLSQVCGRQVSPGEKGNQSLKSAIDYCLDEFNVNWVWIRGEERIQCLTATETAENIPRKIKSIRRKAEKEAKKAATVKLSELDDASRQKLLVNSALLGGIILFTDKKTIKKLESNGTCNTPDPKKLEELFK